ncbi:MAG: hypothetical protein J7J98_09670 [candidate division Zixibacteria bacterium]|nr:hypothetical protein [candidate division Zixibacteria bacterium]
MPDWLRWIAVLPAALLATILSAFPLHFVLYQTLTGSGIVDPYPETPERVLLPLVASMAFIWVGANVAPSHKLKVATSLLVPWLLLLVSAVVMALNSSNLWGMQFSSEEIGLPTVLSIFGAIAGLYIVRKQNQFTN